jgi:hypothetical protein
LPGVDVPQEIRVVGLEGALLGEVPEHVEEQDDDETNHHPEGKVLVERIHPFSATLPPVTPIPVQWLANLRSVCAV